MLSEKECFLITENVVKNAILLKLKENVLIIYDRPEEKIAKLFSEACEKFGAEISLVRIKVREETKREPPKSVAEAMKHADVVLGITTISLTHTKAVQAAIGRAGTIATMPGITKEMFRALSVDYKKLTKICERYAKIFNSSKRIKLKTKKGTNLILKYEGRETKIDDGIMSRRGNIHNLPAGEVGVAPIENSANGKIIFDTCIVGVGKIRTPIEVFVKGGRITKISGGREAQKLIKFFKKANKSAKILCEFSVGTNPKAKLIGKVLNDEKALGTCHVAFGDNKSIGGKNKSNVHIDGVIKKPTVWFDGKMAIKNGKLLI